MFHLLAMWRESTLAGLKYSECWAFVATIRGLEEKMQESKCSAMAKENICLRIQHKEIDRETLLRWMIIARNIYRVRSEHGDECFARKIEGCPHKIILSPFCGDRYHVHCVVIWYASAPWLEIQHTKKVIMLRPFFSYFLFKSTILA